MDLIEMTKNEKEIMVPLTPTEIEFLMYRIPFGNALSEELNKQMEWHRRLLGKLHEAKERKFTNFEKFKLSLTIDDLAKQLVRDFEDLSLEYCGHKYSDKCKGCESCIKAWLESEVKE